MSHAPGYDRLMKWTSVPIMPTPAGEGTMFRVFAESHNVNLIGVGLGGATTNVYSIYDGKFVRSVSANLGMSYSIYNVMKEAGLKNILRWLPFKIEEKDVLNILRNKMIRPTTIPQTLERLIIEHAVAREALRMGFKHHKSLARPLSGAKRKEKGVELYDAIDFTQTYIDLMKVNWIAGTGGLLSHAPRRVQSAMILIDGFQPEGVTRLFQDSVFMIPHLGVLSTIHRKASLEIFEKDCLIMLGTCISFRGHLKNGYGKKVADITIEIPDREVINEVLTYGTIRRIPLKAGVSAQVDIRPVREFRVEAGGGMSRRLVAKVDGGEAGIIIDARGRPLELPEDDEERKKTLIKWLTELEAYPEEYIKNL